MTRQEFEERMREIWYEPTNSGEVRTQLMLAAQCRLLFEIHEQLGQLQRGQLPS